MTVHLVLYKWLLFIVTLLHVATTLHHAGAGLGQFSTLLKQIKDLQQNPHVPPLNDGGKPLSSLIPNSKEKAPEDTK